MRLIHLSDLHFWRFETDPALLMNKRLVGMLSLAAGRARRFRLERWGSVVGRARELKPDHILITGDLTTTALEAEFEDALNAVRMLSTDPNQVTVIPGNHDRYTTEADRARRFESYFGPYMGGPAFPWIRRPDSDLAILGLDPTRSHLSARGFLPAGQLDAAKRLVADVSSACRLIVACHYPLTAPTPALRRELWAKRLVNSTAVEEWLQTIGRHIYCCGHVHESWAHRPSTIPGQIALNPGPPLMASNRPGFEPGFLELDLKPEPVRVIRHRWNSGDWRSDDVPIPAG
jgi:3',5'-cyclic AMP phosphodiesterase CpdA